MYFFLLQTEFNRKFYVFYVSSFLLNSKYRQFSVVELAVFLHVFRISCYKLVLLTLLIRSGCFETGQNVAIKLRGDSERYRTENVKKKINKFRFII